MDFYLTTSASTLPCFQITWLSKLFFQENVAYEKANPWDLES